LPDFALATPYTILMAAGGVTGTFSGFSGVAPSAFLTPKLTYDANDAFLTIAQSASFASAALTPNEKAAAAGADSTGPGNPVWNAIALLPSVSDAPAAFDAVSGEIHASIKTGLIDDSRFIRDAVIGRLRGAFAGDPGLGLSGNKTGDPLPAPADRFGLWAHGFGSWGRWDGNGNAATLDRTIGGVFIGGDAAIADDWRFGLAAGYSRSSFDVDGRASSADVDSYTIAAYGGGQIGALGLRFGAANTWHSIDTSRSIAFPGFADAANASYDARTAQIFGDVGYTIRAGRASFEPFADLAYVHLHTDRYGESGAAGLTASSDNMGVTYLTLGLRAATSFDLGSVAAKAHATLGWRHAFGDTTPVTTQAFANGAAFTVAGVPIAEDAAVIKTGLDFDLTRTAALSLSYVGQIGGGTTDQGGNVTFSMRF
jgi:outer membrane autotransporter protein